MPTSLKNISIENIALEKLTRKTIKDIDRLEIDVWERSQPGISLSVCRNRVELRLYYKASIKKIIAWISGISGAVISIIKLIKVLAPLFKEGI